MTGGFTVEPELTQIHLGFGSQRVQPGEMLAKEPGPCHVFAGPPLPQG
ncbi:hypothetical protein Misp03_16210 [Microbispora sp. NBRC 16548]|nr:hypothetical protein Misp03_16210 [Microbispora sp. NBRC 16548]